MTTALTVLLWLAAAWLTLSLLGGVYALYCMWRDWQ